MVLLEKRTFFFYKERNQEQRNEFQNQLQVYKNQNYDLIYIDESGFVQNYFREFGYAKRGKKILGEKTGNRKNNPRISVISAYLNKNFVAPMFIQGNVDTEVFLFWIEQFLVKELKTNQLVIMDNASFHRSPKIRELIEATDAKLLYLPTYSPDLNPIEQAWAWVKKNLRAVETNAENFVEKLSYFICNKLGPEISV